MPPPGVSPPPMRPPLPTGARDVGAEKPPLFPPEAELRDISCRVSRKGLPELFGSTRFGWVFGASGVSNLGAVFGGASVFGAGEDGGVSAFGFGNGAAGNSRASNFGCTVG